jgi:hypothetical protein
MHDTNHANQRLRRPHHRASQHDGIRDQCSVHTGSKLCLIREIATSAHLFVITGRKHTRQMRSGKTRNAQQTCCQGGPCNQPRRLEPAGSDPIRMTLLAYITATPSANFTCVPRKKSPTSIIRTPPIFRTPPMQVSVSQEIPVCTLRLTTSNALIVTRLFAE